jgi:RimJ/RimL family protein N-acetyltransferase
MNDVLETERLILRRWRDSDRSPFARLNADPRVMEFMPAPLEAPESDRMVDRIEQHFEARGFGLFAAELRAEECFIGFIGLSIPGFDAPFMPAVEVGWRLAFEHWGKGLATEGASEVMGYAFEILRFDRLVSFTTPLNLRSLNVMEKLGMTRNPADDFEHPNLQIRHRLRSHVLYQISWEQWIKNQKSIAR